MQLCNVHRAQSNPSSLFTDAPIDRHRRNLINSFLFPFEVLMESNPKNGSRLLQLLRLNCRETYTCTFNSKFHSDLAHDVAGRTTAVVSTGLCTCTLFHQWLGEARLRVVCSSACCTDQFLILFHVCFCHFDVCFGFYPPHVTIGNHPTIQPWDKQRDSFIKLNVN